MLEVYYNKYGLVDVIVIGGVIGLVYVYDLIYLIVVVVVKVGSIEVDVLCGVLEFF